MDTTMTRMAVAWCGAMVSWLVLAAPAVAQVRGAAIPADKLPALLVPRLKTDRKSVV